MVMEVKRTRKTPQSITNEKKFLARLSKYIDEVFSNPDYRHSPLYYLLKDKMGFWGFWKAKARGNPQKGWRKFLETKRDHQPES